MHAYLIIASSPQQQADEVQKLLAPLAIDPFDITRLSSLSSIGIALVREIKKKIHLRPYKSQTKAIIIEDAQMLTVDAQNALLKTLEEPPDNTIIILLAQNPDSLLPTILSRVQIITVKSTIKTLSAKEEKEMGDILEALLAGKGDGLKLSQTMSKDKETALTFLEKLILYTRQKLLADPSAASLLHFITAFQHTYTLLATTNINPRFALEILFLNLSDTIAI